jgi:hypothetical protein
VDACPTPSINETSWPAALARRILDLFDRALLQRGELKLWIDELSSKGNRTIREQLLLGFYLHQMSLVEPPLSIGVSLNAETLRNYWESNPAKYRLFWLRNRKILAYLKTREATEADDERCQLQMLNLINTDQLTYLALFPVVQDMFKKEAGRQPARPQVAVRALQMKIDTGRTWREITREVCDCGKLDHDDKNGSCKANVRQSVRALEGLLRSLRDRNS